MEPTKNNHGKEYAKSVFENKDLSQINKKRELDRIRTQRQNAYRNESDPLFLKWQRGEATEQNWLDKIEEIKERFPKPE